LWNVRRLCTEIVWLDEGRVRAYGPAAEITERYMNEVNIDVLAEQDVMLHTQRTGTGEVRYLSVDLLDGGGRPARLIAADETLLVRASYRANPSIARAVFQVAIVDVDTGVVVATATSAGDGPTSVSATGTIECRFTRLPLRPRQYVLRLSITDARQILPYDVLTAGPRFAIAGEGGADGLKNGSEEDGLVSLPYEFSHSTAAASPDVVNRA
jgi:hypothetical protein